MAALKCVVMNTKLQSPHCQLLFSRPVFIFRFGASGNALISINLVAVHQARLMLDG